MKAGAADYLSKVHLSIEALERTIHHALALREQERQRQQAEAALRSSEERFRALVENSSDTLLLLDAEGRVTYVTPSSQRHLGWKGEDLIGHSIFDFMHPDDHDLVGTKFAEALQNDLEEIRSAGERAASLTRQLLAFSRRQMLQPQVVDINTLVAGMQKLLRWLVTEHVEVVAALAPDLMPVRVDPSSIEQVL